MKPFLTLLFLLIATPALAQDDDPMAMQRCIWRCLADSSGASDPRYHQCVEQWCTGIEETTGQQSQQPPAPPGQWGAGIATDGFSRYAGLQAADGSGRGFYYMCTPQGQSYLAIFGTGTAAGGYAFQVDGLEYQLGFDRSRGELTLQIPPRAPFLDTLMQGRVLTILGPDRALLMQLPLSGAYGAINNTVYACF